MKALVQATFKIDVSDWFEDEGLTKRQRLEKIKEEMVNSLIKYAGRFNYNKALSDASNIVRGYKEK